MTENEIRDFARSLARKSYKEQKEECFRLFDSQKEIAGELSNNLMDIINDDKSDLYVPKLYDMSPDVYTLWQVRVENKERALRGLPPVGAR